MYFNENMHFDGLIGTRKYDVIGLNNGLVEKVGEAIGASSMALGITEWKKVPGEKPDNLVATIHMSITDTSSFVQYFHRSYLSEASLLNIDIYQDKENETFHVLELKDPDNKAITQSNALKDVRKINLAALPYANKSDLQKVIDKYMD